MNKTNLPSIEQILNRHQRIAFQFSGGKDSIAALLVLKDYWDRFTVYWCDSGDALPETRALVESFAAQLPRFEVVQGRALQSRAEFGLPVDVLPHSSAFIAHQLNIGTTIPMQDRAACCFRSVMLPMHQRMVADGITLVIRGQKDADSLKGPLRSGDVAEGIEFLYPIQDWTDEQCFAYIEQHGIEIPRLYKHGQTHAGDCLGCTAWLTGNRAAYLKQFYPEAFSEYRQNMLAIAQVVMPLFGSLQKAVAACDDCG